LAAAESSSRALSQLRPVGANAALVVAPELFDGRHRRTAEIFVASRKAAPGTGPSTGPEAGAPDTALTIRNVTPALEKKIRALLNAK
jgi:hypothetical protein